MGKVNDAAYNTTRTASARAPLPPAPAPVRVGRYEIGEALGAGAMGVVYRAHDPELDRELAIKLVRAGGQGNGRARLLREAQSMARLRHANVVPIFDVGPAEGGVFVAMPLLDGGTLTSWLRIGDRSLDEILDRFVAAGRGLAAAHAAGIIHRDFKPDNVLLGIDGEVRVADFGLARLTDLADGSGANLPAVAAPALQRREDGATVTIGTVSVLGEVVGTPAYMAPEQLCGQPIDARADQFSFCVALWEGLYGVRPFRNPPPGVADPLRARLDAIAAGAALPAPRRDRPAWLAQILVRGLDRDPEQRWPSMHALLETIAARRAPRHWPWRIGFGLVAVAAIAAAAALAQPSHQPSHFHPVSLTHRGDLDGAAISPDGKKLAMIAAGALVVRGIDANAEEQVVIDHGLTNDPPVAWSPDGKRILVGVEPEIAGQFKAAVIDLDTGERHAIPAMGRPVFLSNSELAITEYRKPSLSLYTIGASTVTPTCDVPGDPTFVFDVVALPGGLIAARVYENRTSNVVFIDRGCHERARYAAPYIESIAASDTGSVIALIPHDGFGELVEIGSNGSALSQRQVSGDLAIVLGRIRGVDHVITRAPKTRLDRIHNGTTQLQLAVDGRASFSLSPDGKKLASIELGNQGHDAGPLRLSSAQSKSLGDHVLRDCVSAAAWSPHGARLAVIAEDGAAASELCRPGLEPGNSRVVILAPTGELLQRLPLTDFERRAVPVWLDDGRVAVQTRDRTTYRWYDLMTGEQGDLVDRTHGSTYSLARSPRDGTLAMWRMGAPGQINDRTEHIWVMPPGEPARPLHVDEALKNFEEPSWSARGELLLRSMETGRVLRFSLPGEEELIAELPATPSDEIFLNHLMAAPDGTLLAVETSLGYHVAVVRPDDERAVSRSELPVSPL